jgi:subtilisin family serine protease
MLKNKLKSIIAGLAAAALVVAGPTIAIAQTGNGNSNAGKYHRTPTV